MLVQKIVPPLERFFGNHCKVAVAGWVIAGRIDFDIFGRILKLLSNILGMAQIS